VRKIVVMMLVVLFSFVLSVMMAYGFSPLFQARTDYPTGRRPQFLVSKDLDGDGDKDIVVANKWDDNISVFMNYGDGTFNSAMEYTVSSFPFFVRSEDLNGDTFPDIVVSGDNISVLLNTGTGTFHEAIHYTVSEDPQYFPQYFAIEDFDDDGDGDIAVTDASGGTVIVLFNNGDGDYPEATSYGVGSRPNYLLAIDINSDDSEDILVANEMDSTVSVILNKGDGSFDPPINYVVGESPHFFVTEDLDGDGDVDLAIAVSHHSSSSEDNVSVLFNNGDGTFVYGSNYLVANRPYLVITADLNGDESLDLITANYGADNVSVLLNNGDGSFAPHSDYDVGDIPTRSSLRI